MITLRQVLKAAQRHGWIQFVPDFSSPYKTSGKISHRAWFSPAEYRQLYMATRQRAKQPLNNRWRWASEQLHDYVLFMANTGLRPDESARLESRRHGSAWLHQTRICICLADFRRQSLYPRAPRQT
jgi:hypothetical protein